MWSAVLNRQCFICGISMFFLGKKKRGVNIHFLLIFIYLYLKANTRLSCGTVPVRQCDEGKSYEVLLIESTSRNDWIFPKGFEKEF